MLAPDQAVNEVALPPLDVRALARRARLPVLLAACGVATVLVAGGHLNVFVGALRRGLHASPGWAAVGIVFESISLAGYVALLTLVAGRATPRIGTRESAQITLAGAAATRLLPTAGAGGAALTVWALRRAGLAPLAAVRTLLAFFVVLYGVFLASIVIAGAALLFGLTGGRGPVALSAIPAVAALLAIVLASTLAAHRGGDVDAKDGLDPARRGRGARLRQGAQLLGRAVHDALGLVRSRDPRVAGAVAYWLFDAAVLWAMLQALGSPPALPVVALAYFIGQVANTLPLPGSVSGGMAGVLIASGVPAGLALPAVLAYRTIAVWLPSPAALAAVPRLRATIASWSSEDITACTSTSPAAAIEAQWSRCPSPLLRPDMR